MFIGKERCPKCAAIGKDKNHDNLGIYSDGGKYCFSCGYTLGSNPIVSFSNKQQVENKPIYLPQDCSFDYPQSALNWCAKYELDRNDLLTNRVMWSEQTSRLIFPVFGEEGLLSYQGRYFGEGDYPKWWGIGNMVDVFHIIGDKHAKTLVLTEDILSSIKVSRFTQAMPIFGSHISTERFKRLYSLLGKSCEVIIWLDYDKRKEATLFQRRGALCGLNTRVIITELDPKEIPCLELQEILT